MKQNRCGARARIGALTLVIALAAGAAWGYGPDPQWKQVYWIDGTVQCQMEANKEWHYVTSLGPALLRDGDRARTLEDSHARIRTYDHYVKIGPNTVVEVARLQPLDPLRAERWELYLGGIELANAYSELNDPAEQRTRFEQANAARAKRGAKPYPLDEAFLAALTQMPPSGGIALGLDRLLMILADADSRDAILPFRHG